MNTLGANVIREPQSRVVWVDYAKGICIIMVVMMHSTLDYGHAIGSEGWLHEVVAWARPFRMPDFFLLSGIFLSLSIGSPLREYVDRKFFHFIYFYFIWLTIQLIVTEPVLLAQEPGKFLGTFLFSWIEPINTLWFVHMLAIFYMVTRLLSEVPKPVVFLSAASLQIAFNLGWIETGWSVPDRFFDRYVYFYAGYAAAPWIFAFARQIPQWKSSAIAGLVIWAVVNAMFTMTNSDGEPGISLALGFLGAVAIVTAGSLLATQSWSGWLRYCGANSIVIYLSFFIPMKIALKLLSQTGVIADTGTASLLVTVVAIAVPLAFHWTIKDTWAVFLYERPPIFKWRRMTGKQLKY
ncbi:MAG: acyltransferase family protein [Pseudohongiella sp.]|nr:acyltransferase family protein [Pseudohongiella sp.]